MSAKREFDRRPSLMEVGEKYKCQVAIICGGITVWQEAQDLLKRPDENSGDAAYHLVRYERNTWFYSNRHDKNCLNPGPHNATLRVIVPEGQKIRANHWDFELKKLCEAVDHAGDNR